MTAIHRVCLVLATLAGPAAAQDVQISFSGTDACLAAGNGTDCIGLASDACLGTEAGGSNVGIAMCWGAEGDWWDAQLNATYGALMALLAERDAEMREIGSAAPAMAPEMRAAQRAWIDWRDATCTYVYSTYGGGSGGSPGATACHMRLTGEQAIRLEEWLLEMGG
jgi:uncharacterized protein YecT (DUF1311 family)